MTIKNSSQQFGMISRANHWISAFLFIGLVILGLYMEDLPKDPFKYELYDIHKSLGVILLGLVVLRLIWLKISPNPPVLASNRMEEVLAKLVKIILYIGLFFIPLSGWIMSNAGGHEVAVFGWFEMPVIVPENHAIKEVAKEIHEVLGATVLPLVILLHFAAAMKHHFVTKDATLSRMTGLKAPK